MQYFIKPFSLLTCLIMGSVSMAHAVIAISSVISTGSETTSLEESPNLWFLLDDSGSMGGRCNSEPGNYGTYFGCSPTKYYLPSSFIPYDPNVTYLLPKRINGSDMPLPNINNNEFYHKPFANDADNNSFEIISIRNPSGWKYADIDGTCWTASDRNNCQIWQNYYSSRMRVLKSALSLSFLANEDAKKLRIGYSSLNTNTNQSENILPVLPLHGSHANSNTTQFNTWLYSLYPSSGTPLRGKMAKLFQNIITFSSETSSPNSKNNPFLKKPGVIYGSNSNPIKSCRRNYAVILTDGAWNSTENSIVSAYLSNPGYIKSHTTEQTQTLPDSMNYTPRSPYTKTYTIDSHQGTNPRTLADIAFAGWKTDMDNNSGNNDLAAKNTKVGGAIQELHGSSYWHPYNDPASWQHINTFTIGFGLSGNAQVNPPKNGSGGINPSYLTTGFKWSIDVNNNGKNINANDTLKDLANAAVAGRGRFYNAKTVADLKRAFDDIIDTIKVTAEQNKRSVRGAGGVTGIGHNIGMAHYSTHYNPATFTGELTQTKLYNGDNAPSTLVSCFGSSTSTHRYGQLCTNSSAKTHAGVLLANNTNRKIISLKRMRNNSAHSLNDMQYNNGNFSEAELTYRQIDFTKAHLSPAMRTRLINTFPTAIRDNFTDEEGLSQLINYVKGDIEQENTHLFRQRQTTNESGITTRNILGATVRSSPVFSGVPTVDNTQSKFRSEAYTNFLRRYLYKKDTSGNLVSECTGTCSNPIGADYVNMIYVGANDGMLHAFRADTLEEVFAYVPNAVYDNLPNIVVADVQQSLVDGGTSVQTVDIVNGATSTWKKILVGAMGSGGKGVYALDVTDPTAANLAKWEYSDFESKMYQKTQNSAANFNGLKSNIGNIIAKPATVQLSDGTWAVVIGNGYNSESNKAALIVINADTGESIQELVLDNSYTNDSVPNGLGPLYFAAYPHKLADTIGRIDRAYAGDLQGNLWVFDFTAATKDGGVTIAKSSGTATEKPLFVAQYTDTGGNTVKQPITVAPLVKRHPSQYGYLVHFGTGSLFAENDLSSTIKNSVYVIWDDWVPYSKGGLPTPRTGTIVERSHLREVEFINPNGEDKTTESGKNVHVGILKPSTNRVNQPIAWAYSGSDFTQKKRGWYMDLLDGERAWQPAFDTFGSHNVEGIGYNTVRYKTDSGTDTSCASSGPAVVNRQMVFNPNDGTQPLANYGTLDFTDDGTTSTDDLIITTNSSGEVIKQVASAYSLNNKILFNSVVTNAYNHASAFGSEHLCSYRTEIKENTSEELIAKQICRRSYIGSWTELK